MVEADGRRGPILPEPERDRRGDEVGGREPGPGLRGVRVIRSAWIPGIAGRLCGMRRHAAAVTLGPVIIVHPSVPLSQRLLRHELEHVKQWRARPLSFPLLYVWHHFRHGYRSNPFEVEARAAEHVANGGPDEP